MGKKKSLHREPDSLTWLCAGNATSSRIDIARAKKKKGSMSGGQRAISVLMYKLVYKRVRRPLFFSCICWFDFFFSILRSEREGPMYVDF